MPDVLVTLTTPNGQVLGVERFTEIQAAYRYAFLKRANDRCRVIVSLKTRGGHKVLLRLPN